MPMTVITIKKAPPSLRGDLTKWTQEIATGVYIGNFNSKIRMQLWKRVKENVKNGEATISYAYRNEIGYNFDTLNTDCTLVDFDGIPLVRYNFPKADEQSKENLEKGFSNASKYRKIHMFSSVKGKGETRGIHETLPEYVVLDIETDGLDE